MSNRRQVELRGCVALITGASAGIGLHVARHLALAGANLVIAARHAENLEAAAVQLRTAGVKVLAVPTDVGRLEDLERLVAAALGEPGAQVVKPSWSSSVQYDASL